MKALLTAAELQQLRSMRSGWIAKALDCRSERCEFKSGCGRPALEFNIFPKHSQFHLLQLFLAIFHSLFSIICFNSKIAKAVEAN